MQNTIHTLKFLGGKKYWRETLDCGNCLLLYFLVLLKYMLPVHVLMPVQCNWGFGGTEGLFCVQETLECFWVLYFLNMGRMMGMCRLMGHTRLHLDRTKRSVGPKKDHTHLGFF